MTQGKQLASCPEVGFCPRATDVQGNNSRSAGTYAGPERATSAGSVAAVDLSLASAAPCHGRSHILNVVHSWLQGHLDHILLPSRLLPASRRPGEQPPPQLVPLLTRKKNGCFERIVEEVRSVNPCLTPHGSRGRKRHDWVSSLRNRCCSFSLGQVRG